MLQGGPDYDEALFHSFEDCDPGLGGEVCRSKSLFAILFLGVVVVVGSWVVVVVVVLVASGGGGW